MTLGKLAQEVVFLSNLDDSATCRSTTSSVFCVREHNATTNCSHVYRPQIQRGQNSDVIRYHSGKHCLQRARLLGSCL